MFRFIIQSCNFNPGVEGARIGSLNLKFSHLEKKGDVHKFILYENKMMHISHFVAQNVLMTLILTWNIGQGQVRS